jgi:uncharacterized protein
VTEPGPTSGRIKTLDLVRGVAVLGILAVNIAGFAGPPAAVYTPRAVFAPGFANDLWFAFMLVAFEGKMRALFSMLFGASLLLFIERAEASGRDGIVLQLRRLGWLALIGYLHWLLLWWGDILLLYAIAGMIALVLRPLPPRAMLAAALAVFALWQCYGVLGRLPAAIAQHAVAEGTASPAQAKTVRRFDAEWQRRIDRAMASNRAGFAARAEGQAEQPLEPFGEALVSLGETVPYMLIGILLHASGLFTGGWPRKRLWLMAGLGIGLGGLASAGFTGWAWSAGWPTLTMVLAINHALGFPHLAMALGYAALLVLAAPALLTGWPGRRLAAAGRMGLSNYLGTTLMMTAAFNGWGLGLAGTIPPAAQPLFVLAAWAAMLAWSAPWLARFRTGPLEWAWRSLTELRWVPIR